MFQLVNETSSFESFCLIQANKIIQILCTLSILIQFSTEQGLDSWLDIYMKYKSACVYLCVCMYLCVYVYSFIFIYGITPNLKSSKIQCSKHNYVNFLEITCQQQFINFMKAGDLFFIRPVNIRRVGEIQSITCFHTEGNKWEVREGEMVSLYQNAPL